MRTKMKRMVWAILGMGFLLSGLLLTACGTPSGQKRGEEEEGPGSIPTIESILSHSSQDQSSIEIITSHETAYTAFKLINPPRIYIDVRGTPGKDLSRVLEVNDDLIKRASVQNLDGAPGFTRQRSRSASSVGMRQLRVQHKLCIDPVSR